MKLTAFLKNKKTWIILLFIFVLILLYLHFNLKYNVIEGLLLTSGNSDDPFGLKNDGYKSSNCLTNLNFQGMCYMDIHKNKIVNDSTKIISETTILKNKNDELLAPYEVKRAELETENFNKNLAARAKMRITCPYYDSYSSACRTASPILTAALENNNANLNLNLKKYYYDPATKLLENRDNYNNIINKHTSLIEQVYDEYNDAKNAINGSKKECYKYFKENKSIAHILKSDPDYAYIKKTLASDVRYSEFF